MECRYCFKQRLIIWYDIDFGPMCADCYRNLRSKFVDELSIRTKMNKEISSEFKLMILPVEIQTAGYPALLIAKKELEKRRYIKVVLEMRGKKIEGIIELYDLKVLFIDKITIVQIGDKILELTPKNYIFIKQQPSIRPEPYN